MKNRFSGLLPTLLLAMLATQLPIQATAATSQSTVTLPTTTLRQYVGHYRLAPGTVIDIALKGKQLSAQLTGQSAAPIYAKAKDEFFYKVVDARISFERNKQGKVIALAVHQHGRNMRAPRIESQASPPATSQSTVTLPTAMLRQYIGHYRLAPNAVFDITLKGKQLYAQLTGQPAAPIYARVKDEFFYKVINAQISFERNKQSKVIALVVHQNGRNMRAPRANTKAAAPSTAERALTKNLAKQRRCLIERPMHVKIADGTLYGLLTVPKGAHDAPGILLIPGSGAVDLNGDAPGLLSNHMYQQLAYALTCNGYAVLRYDKSGLPPSTGNRNDVTIEYYRSDVLALAKALAHEPGVAPNRLILMGHSEGGLIAPYSASKLGDALRAMVLLEAPSEPVAKILLNQNLREARARGESKPQLAKLQSQIQALVKAIRTSHGPRLNIPSSLQDFPLAHIFAPAAGLFRSEMDVDPASLIAQAKVPVLIVQGSADVQVGMENGHRLHAANPHTTLAVIPHMTHDLIRAPGKPIDSAVPPPGAQLDPALVKRITAWLRAHVKPAQ